MEALYVMIPIALVLSFSFIGAFFWATYTGQWDSLDLESRKLLIEKRNLKTTQEAAYEEPT